MIYLLRYRRSYLHLLCILCISFTSLAQEEKAFIIPDSLSNKSYDYLYNKVDQNPTDTISALLYMNTYLAKAIDENNAYRRHRGYISLSQFAPDKDTKFSLIKKAMLDINVLDAPNLLHLYRYLGIVYYEYYEYEEAIENYIKALNIAESIQDKKAEYILYYNIALIKESIGKHDEALSLYKKCLAYETLKNDTIGSIRTKISIAESMRNNKKYDSASYYYQAVISEKHLLTPLYEDITAINEGINLFLKKDYTKSEQVLLERFSKIDVTSEGQKYYILTPLYLGKIQLDHYNDTEKAKVYFTKVDSLVSQTNAVIPNTIEAYEFLIKYYEKREDLKEQLYITNKLYELKTTISSRKLNAVDILHSEFDTPQLLKSKEALIQQLENEAVAQNIKVKYFIAFIIFLILLFILQYNRLRKYRNRFNVIISELNNKEVKSTPNHNTSNTPKLLLEDIDEMTITSILKKLDQFEEKKGFLQKDITLAILAKKCATNTKYLPKVINIHKDKSFVSYINNLRIDYILKELKENKILQKYTIKTISEEAGFNTAESFARAFKNKTGIRPSYYIRNLKKEEGM